MIDAYKRLVEAGLLPEEMPNNYTFNKVRTILSELDKAGQSELNEGIVIASKLEVRDPLAAVIFIKHHLLGAHEAEVDRVVEYEEQNTRYGVLIYPEGEVPINIKYLPNNTQEGSQLRYDPVKNGYTG